MHLFGQVSFVAAQGGSLQDWAARLQSDHRVLFIDCCNSFDPYRLYRVSQSRDCLTRVRVARPFTLYQLRELVLNKLEDALRQGQERVLMVSGVGYFGFDDEVDAKERALIWADVFTRLESLSQGLGLMTLVSDGGVFNGSDR
jgi:hypothetical protein